MILSSEQVNQREHLVWQSSHTSFSLTSSAAAGPCSAAIRLATSIVKAWHITGDALYRCWYIYGKQGGWSMRYDVNESPEFFQMLTAKHGFRDNHERLAKGDVRQG